jgi:AcrR family transcriptional regulator
MRTKRATGGGDRLAPQAFYNAAYKILGEVGHEGLTVDSLCARLGVTKGSFYHHFPNTTEFVAGLLRCWEETIDQYLRNTEAFGDIARAMEAAWPAQMNRPHEAEAALRSWASSNPMVAVTVRRVDQKVEDVSTAALTQVVGDPERGRVLAYMWTSLIAGMQQRPQPLDRELMAAATLDFMRTNLGIEVEVDGEQIRILRMPAPVQGRGAPPTGQDAAT